MDVLYVAMRNEYGDPARGLSFEERNFRSALEGMGHRVTAFDFMERARRDGVHEMRAELVRFAGELQPQLAFFVLFTDEIDAATVEAVGRAGRCPTVNWFADDHWRFDGFTRHMAPAFDLSVTTDPDALPKYAALPRTRVHLSQWACNIHAYSRVADEREHEVTFVGQPHGDRRRTIARLRRDGITVECWGFGWSSGPISHEDMVRVFASSRVNLNLSNSSEAAGFKARARRLLGFKPPAPRPPQIKGRNFEVPGCGGFLLTERVPHLERYFELDREVGVYDGVQDLAERIHMWLANEPLRQAVAEAGYRRVLAEHTYDLRFAEIFEQVGLGAGRR